MKKFFIWPAMKNKLFALPTNIKNLLTCQKVTEALIYLLDNMNIRFGSKLYRQKCELKKASCELKVHVAS